MDIQSLRDLTQKEKLDGRERPWGYHALQRGPSIYLTQALLTTRITPNMVTVFGLVIGVLGALLLTSLSGYFKLIGLFFVYQNILADKVDGELARARGTHSFKGVFLDELNHLIIPPLILAGLIYGLLPTAGSEQALLVLALFTGPLALAITRAMHNIAPSLYAKKMLKYADRFALSTATPSEPAPEQATQSSLSARDMLLMPIRALHQFQDLLVFTITIALTLIIDIVRAQSPFMTLSTYPITSYVTILLTLLYIGIVIENIIKGYRSIESRMTHIANREKSQ